MPDDARLADLERRVAALEARLDDGAPTAAPPGDAEPGSAQPGTASSTASTTPDPEVFWALAGLHARVEAPGAVLITGTVALPDGRAAEWQEGALTGDLLEADWAETAETLTALAHPVRLRLLQRVLAGASTVHELTETEGVGTSGQVYHHLRPLVSAGWLRAVGGGHYEVPVARVVPLLTTILGGRR
ncbi:ArsR/SmtB family transcription factor [Georgenia faecalis]|uniref:ArsR/SmtB family transcription factor n=1 Tax=Georgenia faecalis TaxID=2483799 RepID=UPI000FD879EC|nr:helix-turn-helix domain-containing protein [Georgenia faecalis]